MNAFEYFAPTTMKEAVALLSAHPNARVLAGGTDMLVRMKGRVWTPDAVVDIARLPGAKALTFDAKRGLALGAGVTMRQVELSALVHQRYAALAQGASVVGSVQIRNLATVVGNVCNAAPSADTAPGLIALNAKVRIAGPNGRRSMLVENFMTGPGKTALNPGELVTGIEMPAPAPRTGSAYVRHTPRSAMDIAVVGVAASVVLASRTGLCQAVRIVLGAVAPTPLRARGAEEMLVGQKPTPEVIEAAAERAAAEAHPISDVRASADFRRYLVGVLTARMVQAACEDAQQGARAKRRAA